MLCLLVVCCWLLTVLCLELGAPAFHLRFGDLCLAMYRNILNMWFFLTWPRAIDGTIKARHWLSLFLLSLRLFLFLFLSNSWFLILLTRTKPVFRVKRALVLFFLSVIYCIVNKTKKRTPPKKTKLKKTKTKLYICARDLWQFESYSTRKVFF